MAGDGANAGEVYVSVFPDSKGFWTRFQAETRAQASKVGDDLGGVIGKSIQDRIAAGIRDGLGKAPKEPATRSGTEAGGAFADAFRRRVEAALKSLPKVDIKADSSEADRQIAGIRARLDELRNKKVGVDIGAADAVAELDRLRAKLDEIGGKSANAQVRVDTARASAELAAVQAEIDRVDGRNATVNVDASSATDATTSIRSLVAAGVALGPALVPGAAAGAAAIAALIPVAAGAAGAIGALALGLVGPIGAIKAMSAAEDQSTQSAASLASNQLQVASASDAVRSAQASLGNTLANVADQQRKSAEQVAASRQALDDAKINADRANRAAVQAEADAERALTRSQRDALAAQKDLTAAREDAKRTAEDLANQVVDNAQAQERATFALHDAEQQLQAVRANPQATARQRAEAELTFREAGQHLLELGEQQRRLTEDKARSDAAGIDGSARVVAAQQRVTDSQEQIQASERAVTKAREDAANTARTSAESVAKAQQALADSQAAQASQARQNAFAVEQAQQGVISAQRSLQTATVGAATAGGAAMLKLQQQMDQLSPAGQRFATFLYSLKPALLGLRQTAESGLLPGLQVGIEALLPILPLVRDDIGRFSVEVGKLAAEAGRAFASPYWINFTRQLVGAAIPAMDTAARIAYNLAVGVAGLVRAALPLGAGFGEGLLSFSQRFALAANSLERTQGYQQFLAYVRTEGPIVARTIGEVVTAAVRLVEAIGPLGGVSLTIIRLLAETINALPVSVLTVLAGGIALVVTATKFWAAANSVLGNSIVRDLLAGLQLLGGEISGGFRTGLSTAGAEAGTLGRALGGIRGAAQGAATGLGGLVSMVGVGGALTLGLSAAVIGIGYFVQKAFEQRQRVDELTRSLKALGDAYQKNHNLADQSVKDIINNNDSLSDLVRNNHLYGVSIEQVTRASAGDRDAQHQVIDVLNQRANALQKLVLNEKGTAALEPDRKRLVAVLALRDGLKDEFKQLDKNADVNRKLNDAQRDSTNSQDAFAASIRNLDTIVSTGNPTIGQFRTAISAIGDVSADAGAKADAYAAVADTVAGSQLNATDKASAFGSVLQGLGQATETQGPTFRALSDTFGAIAGSELNAHDKADLLRQSLQLLYGAAISQTEADEAGVKAKDELGKQLHTNAAGFDLNTAKTADNRAAVLANRDALEAALQSARDKYIADIAAGVSEDDARAKHDLTTQSIINQIDPTYRNSGAVQDLVNKYGAIPEKKETQVSTPGLDDAINKLIESHAVQIGVSQHPPWTKEQIASEIDYLKQSIAGHTGLALTHAEGGPVPGFSPHERADNIPAWLTAGEWVHPVAAVGYYGPHVMEAMQSRQIPREMFSPDMLRLASGIGHANGGLIRRLAGGGPAIGQGDLTRWPIGIATQVTMPVSLDDLWRQWNAARSSAFVGPGAIPANIAASLSAWIGAAIGITGVPAYWADRLPVGIMRESGGNPRAINLWDSNAQRGDPSRGIMQTIGSTFERYRDPRLPDDIYDPVANIVAGINYIRARYGDILNVQQFNPSLPPMGYDSGGPLPPGLTMAYNGTGKTEWVLTADQMRSVGTGGGANVTVNVYGGESSPHEIAQMVKHELAWELR